MSLSIGTRLIVDKCRATVRYVGFVEGHQGTWVGLEWDDVSRGKHDGTVGGRRYFTCRDSAPRGSLVRETKLLQVAGLGTSIASAITKRCIMQSKKPFAISQSMLLRKGCPEDACTYVMQI